MQKKIIVITEREFDARILTHLLSDESGFYDFKIVPTNYFMSAIKTTNGALRDTNFPVILTVDTNTFDTSDIEEKKGYVDFFIATVLYEKRIKKLYAVPEMEIILINNKDILQQALGREISDEVWNLAKLSPQRAWEQVFKKDKESFIEVLKNPAFRKELQKDELIKAIFSFAEQAEYPEGITA